MDDGEAVEIIKALAEGVDPFTGAIFPPDSPCQNEQTVRALQSDGRRDQDSGRDRISPARGVNQR